MDERILIIDNDEDNLKELNKVLTFEGYLVDTALTGKAGLILADEQRPDLVILELPLPNMSGLDVIAKLLKISNQPVLVLTNKNTTENIVNSLDAGADDYMVKPFQIEELAARIRALLRRTAADRIKILDFEGLSLNNASRSAKRGNREIELTAKEYDLLDFFLRHPRRVLPREVIFERVWDYDFGGESNVLDVYIRYLRQKLEAEGEPRLIYTVRGVGYVLREPKH